MALGGGTFTTQNKILPGSYINVVSTASAGSTLSERGTAAIAIPLAYSPEGVFEVTNEILMKKSYEYFMCSYDDASLAPIREALLHANKVLVYNLADNSTAAEAADLATARYKGSLGNNIHIEISEDPDDDSGYIVYTLVNNKIVDSQKASADAFPSEELTDNDYVTWSKQTSKTLTNLLESGDIKNFSGGTSAMQSGTLSHQAALNAFEPYSFNTLAVSQETPTTFSSGSSTASSTAVASMVTSYTKNARDSYGKKFQAVVYNYGANYEGVVNVVTAVTDTTYPSGLIFWVAGLLAGCALNRSALNTIYDGEYTPVITETQSTLEEYIEAGKFALHKVGDDARVLKDVNSLTTTTEDKGEIFKSNQTIRVVDQIANDIANTFNTGYLGAVQNSDTGRALLKADIVEHHKELNSMNAIEGFTASDITVEQGEEKGAVVVTDAVTIVGTMEKLYMTVYVS